MNAKRKVAGPVSMGTQARACAARNTAAQRPPATMLTAMFGGTRERLRAISRRASRVRRPDARIHFHSSHAVSRPPAMQKPIMALTIIASRVAVIQALASFGRCDHESAARLRALYSQKDARLPRVSRMWWQHDETRSWS